MQTRLKPKLSWLENLRSPFGHNKKIRKLGLCLNAHVKDEMLKNRASAEALHFGMPNNPLHKNSMKRMHVF